MADEVRPVIKPILVVNLLGYAVGVGVVAALLALLPLPFGLYYSLLWVVALLAGAFLALTTAVAAWRHFTEEYAVDGDQLLIKRGLLTRTGAALPFRNISEVQAILPFLLRFLGVGLVRISTNDGGIHTLYNIRGPAGFAERIRALLKK